jgi:HEAT repeat protein
MRTRSAPDFSVILKHLQDVSTPFPPKDLYHFSDLGPADLDALERVWPTIPVERRRNVMDDLSEISDANFEVTFESVFRLGLEDEDPQVRATSIRSLWEAESLDLIAPFIEFMEHDPVPEVRAAAATALGSYVYQGELEELPERHARRIEEALLQVIGGEDAPEVRRRALEAISYSGRPEIPGLIEAAYGSSDDRFRVSAVFAMGRHGEAERWARPVLAELENGAPELRFEAARAAGELGLNEAVPALTQLAEDGDQQVRQAAIWSLSQIGGPEPRRVLTELLALTDESENEYDFIEEALDNLDFTDDLQNFDLFDFGEEGDLEEEDNDRPSINLN